MASSPAADTPRAQPQRATAANRSFTVPAKLATPSKPTNAPAETSSSERYETLYLHPNTKVIKFKSSGSQGNIPWASSSEHTSASGQLEIYRVLGSVSFIRSGAFLLQLLPRSQCWCVDGISKFAFCAKEPGTYYRVELPAGTDEDKDEVEKFKLTLQKITFYERTPCPFSRTFSVDLPEQPEVKKKKRRSTGEKAKKWRLDHAYGWKPEGWEPGMDEPEEGERSGSASDGSQGGSEDDSESAAEHEDTEVMANTINTADVGPSARTKAIRALRSASTPQPRIAQPRPTSRLKSRVGLDGTVDAQKSTEEDSRDQEVSTLRSFQAIPTDMPPSPPDSSAGPDYLESQVHIGNAAGSNRVAEDEDAVTGTAQAEDQTTDHKNVRPEDKSIENAEHREIERSNSTSEEEVENLGENTERLDVAPILNAEDEGPNQTVDRTVTGSVIEPEQSVEQLNAATASIEFVEKQETEPSVKILAENEEPEEIREESADEPAQLIEDHNASFHPLDTASGEEEEAEVLQPATPEEQQSGDDSEDNPTTPLERTISEDPYAAIQARILARRSLSGTTSFHPLNKSPTRGSTSSTSSSATMISTKNSRTSRGRQNQQRGDISSSLVNRAYSVFLGPPAHLVQVMLRIAARFANGAFGVNSMFYVESPIDSPRKIPGSYRSRVDGVEEIDVDEELESEDEDDFGVPLNRPASNVADLRERRVVSGDVD